MQWELLFLLVTRWGYSQTLKMYRNVDQLVRTTRRHIPEDGRLFRIITLPGCSKEKRIVAKEEEGMGEKRVGRKEKKLRRRTESKFRREGERRGE
jgi:hypothetical protein